MQGPGKGAWDLVKNIALSSSQESKGKDLVNTTIISDPQPFFRREYASLNGTLSVKTEATVFESANYDSLQLKWDKSSGVNSVISDIKAGETYILKLRNSDTLVVLKITEIRDDGCSLQCFDTDNMDYIQFDYKLFIKGIITGLNELPKNVIENEELIFQKDEELNVTIKIYPNPVTKNGTIELSESVNKECKIVFYDLSGVIVHTGILKPFETEYKFEKGQVASGNYIAALQTDFRILSRSRFRID